MQTFLSDNWKAYGFETNQYWVWCRLATVLCLVNQSGGLFSDQSLKRMCSTIFILFIKNRRKCHHVTNNIVAFAWWITEIHLLGELLRYICLVNHWDIFAWWITEIPCLYFVLLCQEFDSEMIFNVCHWDGYDVMSCDSYK